MKPFIPAEINTEEELKKACKDFRKLADEFKKYQEPMAMYVAFECFINDCEIKVNVPKSQYHKIISSMLYYDWPNMAKPYEPTE